jgi:acetolactate synthase-1/2/3 large subunit
MISGGGAMHLNDSFGRYLNYICNHNEQASAIAAEGYSRAGQKLAAVNVTTGPGGLNCLNGLFGQWTDSVPVLYISGQVKCSTMMAKTEDKSLRQLGDQEVDIVNVVKPIVKYAKTVTNPNEIRYILDKAIFLALHGRKGPVWIDIPIDIQATMIDENNLKEYDEAEDTTVFDNNKLEKHMDELSGLIKNAKKPLIIAGHGIRLARAKDEFLNLIKKLNIPVVTTMNGFDLVSHDNPLFIGRIGTVGNRCANFALQNADLVISIG